MARRIASAEWTDAIRTRAELHLDHQDGGWAITRIDLEGKVSLDDQPSTRELFQDEFRRIVGEAASNCPISRALTGVEITVDAEPADRAGHPDPAPSAPRPAANRHAEEDRRKRRAFQGEVISRIRARARHDHALGADRPTPRG